MIYTEMKRGVRGLDGQNSLWCSPIRLDLKPVEQALKTPGSRDALGPISVARRDWNWGFQVPFTTFRPSPKGPVLKGYTVRRSIQ